LIKKIQPDLIISAGWRKLISKEVFSIPRFGAINIHDGLLPKYRGFAPINWCIINGEKEAGITTHYIDEFADTGNILLQKKAPIKENDTAFDIYNKLLELSQELILETLSLVESSPEKNRDQKTMEKGFFCSRRFPDDGRINWNLDRTEIYNLIRALSDPYPNAFCYHDTKKIKIVKAKLSNEDFRGPFGRICSIQDNGIIVTCGTNPKKIKASS
jgi:methionyl-tRNA formyltransferase